MSSRYQKWGLIVVLNSIISFYFAVTMGKGPGLLDVLGMLAGIATFVVVYAELESWLVREGHHKAARQLVIAALLKALTQLAPALEIAAGMISLQSVNFAIGYTPFISHYLTTLLNGALLSLAVAGMFAIVQMAMQAFYYFRQQKAS